MKIVAKKKSGFLFYSQVIRAIIGPKIRSQTLIDLCSCEATVTRNLEFRDKVYVDILNCWNIPGQMHRFVQADVLGDHECLTKHYDVANCSDGIEHLTKEDGFRLIERMKTLSDKQILFTPLGDYLVEVGNPDPKCHKSGWLPEDFPGFAAIVAPNFHPMLGIGAFWVWRCPDIEADFKRVKTLLSL